jgi:hypothetical protein
MAEDGRVLATRRVPEGLVGLRVLHELLATQVEDPVRRPRSRRPRNDRIAVDNSGHHRPIISQSTWHTPRPPQLAAIPRGSDTEAVEGSLPNLNSQRSAPPAEPRTLTGVASQKGPGR